MELDLQSFHQLQQARRFPYLLSLGLERVTNPSGAPAFLLQLTLELGSELAEHGERLRLRCEGVQEFKLGAVDCLSNWHLTILPIHTWQWEGLHYKVTEDEENAISFFCKHIQVDVLS